MPVTRQALWVAWLIVLSGRWKNTGGIFPAVLGQWVVAGAPSAPIIVFFLLSHPLISHAHAIAFNRDFRSRQAAHARSRPRWAGNSRRADGWVCALRWLTWRAAAPPRSGAAPPRHAGTPHALPMWCLTASAAAACIHPGGGQRRAAVGCARNHRPVCTHGRARTHNRAPRRGDAQRPRPPRPRPRAPAAAAARPPPPPPPTTRARRAGAPPAAPARALLRSSSQVGADDLQEIQSPLPYPYSAIGLLVFDGGESSSAPSPAAAAAAAADMSICTGFLISPDTVLTAAHCLYTVPNELRPDRPRGYRSALGFLPSYSRAANGSGVAPLGRVGVSWARVAPEWVDYAQDNTFYWRGDLGAVRLDRKVRKVVGGWMGGWVGG